MKKLFFVIAPVVLAFFLVSAFTKPDKVKKTDVEYMWFDFSGTSLTDYSNLSLYTQDPSHADPCTGEGLRCEILAPVIQSGSNAGKPDLSDIQDETFKE